MKPTPERKRSIGVIPEMAPTRQHSGAAAMSYLPTPPGGNPTKLVSQAESQVGTEHCWKRNTFTLKI
jgi:hypothetical protein